MERKRQQARNGTAPPTPLRAEAAAFIASPQQALGGKRGKLIPILERALAALNSQDCSPGAHLPNGFSPGDPGVDYFFSINPAGRGEKFSSSQGHLGLVAEEEC